MAGAVFPRFSLHEAKKGMTHKAIIIQEMKSLLCFIMQV
ncbi:hypothetical protein PI172_2299 [Prevotella intermedia]|uniref:Uncharacterized protein n=1 Tax=Prevotella intermedia TaxID=28131 RepID=A0AAD1F8H3_PREIN|nr:hypothetical protein PI172_2299 [Prevotella intermedia]